MQESANEKADARIFSLVGTVFNFIGLVVAITIWKEEQTPISCVFNCIQGIMYGHWWPFTPMPQLGNSIGSYVLCWGFYFLFCIIIDSFLIKHMKR